jgi:hypothetical protein
MRMPHVIAIFAVAILAVGSRLFLFKMHKDKQNIPVRDVHDMSFVFDRDN